MSLMRYLTRTSSVLAVLIVLSLPGLAQKHQTSASIKQSHTSDAQACKGRMNCYNTEMRKAAAIRNADRKAKAQLQSQSKSSSKAPEATQQEVKQ
jgi:hypothetical protein